ncbi:MAG: methylmalonyl Co-A mutase-associated GTPase MeaB [Planctomycetota bacterium]|nr:MAG: methylmalonyl Co-A mutase-associated GTPase MeaB [Planctomycetota bacterium]REJ88560.1 MAG: methylmalonyl Co-A mutase-associated GTPase MeaB [Planctomycetota bacterium]REK22442.1 MAG: methylmalonyl Co-A mutase-associated GTPase MeaB [Planctomycetota bacterium]REK34908.1 MAG: methylmalonyl Co-A mutase-associated GTPase MeaB [Planctomycetota bacterium]
MTSEIPRRRELTVDEYYEGVRRCDITTLARALTLIESNNANHQVQAEALLAKLLPHTGQAVRVGITGVPGVGKSTFIEALGLQLVGDGKRVAVLAVDPSSGISGGSILGDKTRMTRLSVAPEAFIRPSPSAGTLGGVARKTRESILACEAAGFDVVIVETVGVGQSESMVAEMTDCFVALMLPGAGDDLQGIKRGLLELVDVVVINKADGRMLTAAQLAARQYATALETLLGRSAQAPPVLTCSALRNEHISDVWTAVDQHCTRLRKSGELAQRRSGQNIRWMWSIVDERVKQSVRLDPAVRAIRERLESDVQAGTIPPESAAREILKAYSRAEKHRKEST